MVMGARERLLIVAVAVALLLVIAGWMTMG